MRHFRQPSARKVDVIAAPMGRSHPATMVGCSGGCPAPKACATAGGDCVRAGSAADLSQDSGAARAEASLFHSRVSVSVSPSLGTVRLLGAHLQKMTRSEWRSRPGGSDERGHPALHTPHSRPEMRKTSGPVRAGGGGGWCRPCGAPGVSMPRAPGGQNCLCLGAVHLSVGRTDSTLAPALGNKRFQWLLTSALPEGYAGGVQHSS